MTYYGVLLAEFWTGVTGRGIRRDGGKDAQLLAAYLVSSPHANMLGLYHLPPAYVRQDSGLSFRAFVDAAQVLQRHTFAFYDARSEYVWVKEMARVRLNLGPERPRLEPGDNRVIAANRIYHALRLNPFLGPFFEHYRAALHLRSRREGPLQAVLWSDSEAPSKPGNRSQDQDQSTGSGSGSEKSTGAGAPAFPENSEEKRKAVETSDPHLPTHALMVRIVRDEYREHPDADELDRTENIKVRCAKLGLTYSAEAIWQARDAVDAADARKRKPA